MNTSNRKKQIRWAGRSARIACVALWFLLSVACAGAAEELKAFGRDQVPMAVVPSGPFLMGSAEGTGRADEYPQRRVQVDAFAIDQVEVTNVRYLQYIRETGRKEPPNPYNGRPLSQEPGIADRPVVQVTWHDAVDYCRWASKRLPTEAEWEKAARGTDGRVFPWGNDPLTNRVVNYNHNWQGRNTLWPVGSHPQTGSPYNVLDMVGNVREWVQDWYRSDYYRLQENDNPQGPDDGILKVIKGGSWHSFVSDIRAAARGKGGFALKTDGIGFRCARSLQGTEPREVP